MPAQLLTKSSFTSFIECAIKLWLEKVRPDIGLPEEPGLERIFEQGRMVDDLARGLYPGGIAIKDYNHAGFKNTQAAIASGAKVLYQPTAVADGLSARADILTLGKGGKWDLHEVKMATEVKEDYLYDVAFQKLCFEAAGIPIGKTFLAHINNKYVRQGEVEVDKLFTEEDISAKVADVMTEVENLIPQAKAVFKWPRELAAQHLAGCPDLTKCAFAGRWFNHFDPSEKEAALRELDAATVAEMLENGVVALDGLSDDYLASIPYRTPEERWPLAIDRHAIKKEIEALEYPLYFFDYETYYYPVPPFDGYVPYQQIPFQYSLYVLDAEGAEPRIHDFLMPTFEDPALALIEDLKSVVGPTGNFIAWNASFEMGRNKDLATIHPEHAEFMLGINTRMYDLMMPFKRKAYVHPGFRGSASLKKVMPTLIPELSYDKLGIHKGDEASASWPVITDPATPEEQRKKLIADEIEYCRLDVYAMVRILEELRKIAEPKNPFE
ncbi:MAG: DUF2779 domain-containing protein [Patescibacteria group bacterium]